MPLTKTQEEWLDKLKKRGNKEQLTPEMVRIIEKARKIYKDEGGIPPSLSFWIEAMQAVRKEAQLEILEEVKTMIDLHDPNIKMNRKTSPAYWGNTLREDLANKEQELKENNINQE